MNTEKIEFMVAFSKFMTKANDDDRMHRMMERLSIEELDYVSSALELIHKAAVLIRKQDEELDKFKGTMS